MSRFFVFARKVTRLASERSLEPAYAPWPPIIIYEKDRVALCPCDIWPQPCVPVQAYLPTPSCTVLHWMEGLGSSFPFVYSKPAKSCMANEGKWGSGERPDAMSAWWAVIQQK